MAAKKSPPVRTLPCPNPLQVRIDGVCCGVILTASFIQGGTCHPGAIIQRLVDPAPLMKELERQFGDKANGGIVGGNRK